MFVDMGDVAAAAVMMERMASFPLWLYRLYSSLHTTTGVAWAKVGSEETEYKLGLSMAVSWTRMSSFLDSASCGPISGSFMAMCKRVEGLNTNAGEEVDGAAVCHVWARHATILCSMKMKDRRWVKRVQGGPKDVGTQTGYVGKL